MIDTIKDYRTCTGLALLLAFICLFAPGAAFAAAGGGLDLTQHWAGYACLVIFVLAYAIIISEENLHLRKSKPAIVAAGFIWVLVALAYAQHGDTHTVEAAIRQNLLEFVELFLFLLAAMTYINTMEERGVFELLRAKLVSQGYSLRKIFWITGVIAFFMSPIADNLTTALLMAAVVIAIGGSNYRFVSIACVNIVVAANAGGAFSPFGDITTLMVWQKGLVEFQEFFALFIPSVVNWVVTAAILAFAIPKTQPEPIHERSELKFGAWIVVGLFIVTITMAVSFHNMLHMPPAIGMMTGLGLLQLFGYYLKRRDANYPFVGSEGLMNTEDNTVPREKVQAISARNTQPYDIYRNLRRAEWDTLLFFYGIILCVGGLGTLGYLGLMSEFMYDDLGATKANILVGFASALIDNIPVMFAVLEMNPDMGHGQWLLVTLTAGVGGSMLSIGSAAGVAVMGQARGIYTFFSHLKWAWAIALGYGASIATHFYVNAGAFQG